MNNYRFRAWNTIEKTMGEPFTLQQAIRIRPSTDETENCIYMQSTGLKDKNGVEIYEDDICNDGSRVVFLGGRYVLMYLDGKFEDLIGDEDEVIGNIYQNPELLNNN